MSLLLNMFIETWHLFLESSIYVLFGLLVSGLLRVFFSPAAVAHHFGQGRISSVFKAAALGVPIPLCSCGVLPAAVGFRRQGANVGATTAFLISTPESGVDSISISYALLDPVLTVARPLAAFFTAALAGVTTNLLEDPDQDPIRPDLTCPVDACCDGQDCPPEIHGRHHTRRRKVVAGIGYAFGDIWGDMAGWYCTGLLLAGGISALIPSEILTRYLGGGLTSMLLMLAVGLPLYVCATASTPIAAALILKGVSPGAALVFLLAGPATNVTSLTVLWGVLGRKATIIYLTAIAIGAVGFGLLTDQVYALLGLSPRALIGQAAELLPDWIEWVGALALICLSVGPLSRIAAARWKGLRMRLRRRNPAALRHLTPNDANPGCGSAPT